MANFNQSKPTPARIPRFQFLEKSDRPALVLGSHKPKTRNTMSNKQMGTIAKWITEHESALKSLYKTFQKDSNDKKTTFTAFASHMYIECKH